MLVQRYGSVTNRVGKALNESTREGEDLHPSIEDVLLDIAELLDEILERLNAHQD